MRHPVPATTRHPGAAARALLALGLLLAATPSRAVLQDEIQVYLDDINKSGEFGLQMHLNATPVGRETPDYPGEVVSAHGYRATAEFAYGLGHGLEAGLYVPTLVEPHGGFQVAGVKLRMKWVWLASEAHDGYFAGVNAELGRVAARYEQPQTALELRFFAGHDGERWLLACNPIFGFELSGAERRSAPDVQFDVKVARKVATGLSIGGEYYPDFGRLNEHSAFREQDHRVFATLDLDRKPWVLNVGIGYGLTPAADRWTVKAIVNVPF